MFRIAFRSVLATVAFALAVQATVGRADPVINTHPRLLLTAVEKSRLLAKKNANDVSWQAHERGQRVGGRREHGGSITVPASQPRVWDNSVQLHIMDLTTGSRLAPYEIVWRNRWGKAGDPQSRPMALQVAGAYTFAGELDQGLKWIERSYAEHEPILAEELSLGAIEPLPNFVALANIARYDEMLHRVKLPSVHELRAGVKRYSARSSSGLWRAERAERRP